MLGPIAIASLASMLLRIPTETSIALQGDIERLCRRLETKQELVEAGAVFSLINSCRDLKGLPKLKTKEEKEREELQARCDAVAQGRATHNEAQNIIDKCDSIPKAPVPAKQECVYLSIYNPNVCTLPADHPERPRTKHYDSPDIKMQLIKDMMTRAGVSTDWIWVEHAIKKARIIAQERQRIYSQTGHSLRGGSGCWMIPWHPQKRLNFTFEPTRVAAGSGPPGYTGGGWSSGGMSKSARKCLERGGVLDAIWDP